MKDIIEGLGIAALGLFAGLLSAVIMMVIAGALMCAIASPVILIVYLIIQLK
jgi:hypothetical protein